MQNAQAQQDPVVKMQQQELQIKAQREQREAAKDQAEIQLKQQAQEQKVMMERERLESQERISNLANQTKLVDSAAEMEARRGIVRSSKPAN